MKAFSGTLTGLALALLMGAHVIVLAFNDNQEACSIPSNEFVSLIQSINHAERNFLFETDELVPRMWWGATLGFNESLEGPLERDVLERTIIELRERAFFIPELTLFQRIQEVRNERNALDFFLLVSNLCERGLVTKAEAHTEAAIRRAHASLGDTYSVYLTPAETERYLLKSVSDTEGQEDSGKRRGLEYVDQLSANIYILKINSFYSQHVASEVRNAFELIVSECSFPNIIVDLRDNLGGFTDASIEVSRSFLRNQPIVQFEDREGLRESFIADADDNNFHPKSLTVLINNNTASAAEIVAAALGESGALTVGSTTYGKAVGQRIVPLSNGWASRITSFRIYSPSGSSWQDIGITPEIDITTFVFPFTDEQTDTDVELPSTLYLDPVVLVTHQLIQEDESWDPRCGP